MVAVLRRLWSREVHRGGVGKTAVRIGVSRGIERESARETENVIERET